MKFYILPLLLCFSNLIFSQEIQNKIPKNAPFVLSLNGKNISEKIDLKTIQQYPWIQNFVEKESNFYTKDLSQTGIDFSKNHYQYYTEKDSVKTYVVLIPLIDSKLFEMFLQKKNGDTIKINKSSNYSRITISKNCTIGWNDKLATIINGSYTAPYKYNNDIALPTIDTVAVESETKYEEKQVVVEKTAKNKAKQNKKNKKAKKQKKELVLEEEPVGHQSEEPTIQANYTEETNSYEKEEARRRIVSDSLEQVKINKSFNLLLEDTYSTSTGMDSDKNEFFKKMDSKADLFISADLSTLTGSLLGLFAGNKASLLSLKENTMLDSEFYINGYFEKNKIRLSQVMTPKGEEAKKLTSNMFDSKINKKLLNYIGNDVLAYYSIAMNTEAIMKYQYNVLRNTLNNLYKNYSKDESADNIDVIVDALEIFLDEKAISDIFPGDALIVLHDLKTVKKEYTSYEYNDEYEKTEIKGIKEETIPNFTFVSSTRNEKIINKILRLPLNRNKFTATDYQEKNGYYVIHFEKDNLIENLYLGLKDGVFMITTSNQNIENLIQQNKTTAKKEFRKTISKNASAAWIDIHSILLQTKSQFQDKTKESKHQIALRNTGEITMESKFKNDELHTETTYKIGGEHQNSLQYLFDVINELYTESKKEKSSIQE
jgi:hypothetical protein